MPNFRKLWFEHVATTRKKLSTKKKPCSHRDAMAKASISWPKIKQRLERKAKRNGVSKPKPVKSKPVSNDKSDSTDEVDQSL